jgi:class 3 adenylate cyclase
MTSDHQILERREHFAPRRRDFQRHEARVVPVRSTERKFATVLFVDVQSSMNLSAVIELEEWWSILTGLFELMCEGVCRCGGWVGSFTGDGIKGVFEAPDAAEAHARGACDAALWLCHALRRPAAELLDERGLELAVRIGINSGEVVTGTIGDRYGRFYTATGYAVALAKRIEALALPGRVYVSEHTAALVDGTHQLRNLGRFSVKGAQVPVGVFELMKEGR